MKPLSFSRREALRSLGAGFGTVGLAGMLGSAMARAEAASPLAVKKPHFTPKAKNVIFLFLNGGLSQMDSFDYKPLLDKYHGQPLPYPTPRTEFATGNLMRSPFQFKQYGQNGTWVSELFPKIASRIDDFCIIRSMQTDIPNHSPSMIMMNTGLSRPGRPAMGSWVTYGLGTENQNLPGFIVVAPGAAGDGGTSRWSSAFLPAVYQGSFFSNRESNPNKAVQYLANGNLTAAQQQRQIGLVKELDELFLERVQSSELEASIQSMETAYRMQTEVPDVFDLRKEPEATRERYGDSDFGRGCLLARRLVERGVRMVQVYFGNKNDWDHHVDIMAHKRLAPETDAAVVALLEDLKQRGLLDDTVVLLGSEFGRTPVLNLGGMFVNVKNGRDHNVFGFTYLLAGGGIKGGSIYGSTDDFGFKVAENPVHVHDLHATVLHLLGLDHERLTYRYGGRDYRLTDVAGRVVKDIIA